MEAVNRLSPVSIINKLEIDDRRGWSFRLASGSILEEDTAVQSAVFRADTLFSGGSWWSLRARLSVGAGIAWGASVSGWSFRARSTWLSVDTWLTIGAWGPLWTRWTLGSNVSGRGRSRFGRLSGISRGSVGSWLARWSWWALWTWWSGLSIFSGSTIVAGGTRGTWFSLWARWSRWTRWARFADWRHRWYADRWRATGETGLSRTTGRARFAVFARRSRGSLRAADAAVVAGAGRLTFDHGPVRWHHERTAFVVAHLGQHVTCGSLAVVQLGLHVGLDRLHVVVDDRQRNENGHDRHHAEAQGRIGHEFVGLFSAVFHIYYRMYDRNRKGN